ncbi:hypothetical protein FJY63_01645 [Candidatus Sumerlaeota bacterium]|nr:hypothetical protein [Candidatus Sumerlaeota bacterium]
MEDSYTEQPQPCTEQPEPCTEQPEPCTEQPEPSEPPGAGGPTARRVVAIVALCIAAASAAHFFYLHQYQPNSVGTPGLLSTFHHLFNVSDNPYHVYLDGIDWTGLAFAGGAALVLMLVGLLALHSLDLYIPLSARLALAYVVGVGLVGVALEVETIFGIYYNESIKNTISASAILLGIIAIARGRRKFRGRTIPNWGACRPAIAREHNERFRQSLYSPTTPSAKALYCSACGVLSLLIIAVTALTFYHGACCPETYWDSLILYVGYAREIFYQRAFPFKAVAQVGIGLGANYPHLFSLMAAATATFAGSWSDTFAQVAPPLAGLLSCVLVYHMTLRLTRHRLLALALTALFRTIPYGIAYFIYASDYAFVMLFVAAFLYVALLYVETGLVGYFILATLIPAFAMHINYLMGMLWVIWLAMLILAHARPIREPAPEPLEILDEEEMPHDEVAERTICPQPPTLPRLLVSARLWGWLAVAVLIASPWYVRNRVVTGNPVYAFFPSLFPKTIHYNREVMDSARVEWTLNGDGIGRAALDLYSPQFWQHLERFRRARDVSQMEIARIKTPLWRKIAATPLWLTHRNTGWKMAPALLGIALPGLLIFLIGSRPARAIDASQRLPIAHRRFGWLCVLTLLFLLAYHYLLADFYLYQIIAVVVLIPLFGAYFVLALPGAVERGIFVALAMWIAIFPGLPMALMGFKIKSEARLGQTVRSPFELVALHNIGVSRDTFYQLAYGDDRDEWAVLNTTCLDETVLTHENRHLVLDRRVKIVHFDDWDVQALWRKSAQEQLRGLRDLGITYYMFVPNEINHQVNRRLGPPAKADVGEPDPPAWKMSALRGWIEDGALELVMEIGDNRLYRFNYRGL